MYENQNKNKREYQYKWQENIDPGVMIDFWNEDLTKEGIEDDEISEKGCQDYEVDELTLKKT